MIELKFSLITPSHVFTPYLVELYDSIVASDYPHWEWILYLNGSFTEDQVPDVIRNDGRVIIHRDDTSNSNIGYLKLKAFSLGTGDILVELDHDDLITTDCLSVLNETFQDPEIGFAYSDNAIYSMNSPFVPYNPAHGWTHSTYQWRDQTLTTMYSPLPTSHSIGYVWYSPDHVRAWRSSVYKAIGGHNRELSVCDDHELIVRTYLASKIKKIEKVLYIYRVTGNNTTFVRNELIQQTTRSIFHQYIPALAEKDADSLGLLKIELDNGTNSSTGYLHIGKNGVDRKWDLNVGIPLPDNSAGIIKAGSALATHPNPAFLMGEIFRVLADGGWAILDVEYQPNNDSDAPFWNENSFKYFTTIDYAKKIGNSSIRFSEHYFDNIWINEQTSHLCSRMYAIKSNKRRLPGIHAI